MGLLADLIEKRVSLANPDQWLSNAFGGSPTNSGVKVDEQTALKFSAVWASVRLVSETLAALPLIVYERDGKGKNRAINHPLTHLLHDRPNPEMTSFTYRQTIQAHVLTWGNGYSEIEYNRAGEPIALWPLLPDRTWPVRKKGKLIYKTRVGEEAREVTLPRFKVLHIPGLGFNGLQGYSPIQLHREAVGLGQAAEQFGARTFGSGARPSGIIHYDGKFSTPEARRQFRREFEEHHAGMNNAQRIAVLEKGMTWKQAAFPPRDAEYIKTRQFQIRDVARIFRVPPHLIGDMESATYSNIEQQSLDFATNTMFPWLVNWEQRVNSDLVTDPDRFFAEFLMDALVRGDLATRYEAYATGRQWGWLSADDVRRLENMNPLPEGQGDIYMVPLNMIPAGQLGEDPPSGDVAPRAVIEPVEPRALLESPEHRSLRARRRLQEAHIPAFQDAAARVVSRISQDVRAAVRKHLAERDVASFSRFVEGYFDEARIAGTSRIMRPALETLASAVYAEAANEVKGEEDMDAEANRLVREYADTVGIRMTRSGSGQLKTIIADTPSAELADALSTRLDEWSERLPSKVARREVVQLGAAVAKRAWKTAGITLLVWRAVGDNCRLCDAMDGRTVGIDKTFLASGETLDPGGVAPLRATSDHGHPPLHEGCDCMITPG